MSDPHGGRTPADVPDITLAEFMNARLDEDEQVARAAAGWPLPVPPGHDLAFVDDYDQPTRIMDGAAAHIARHDPARVLAEAEAKRRIVREFAAAIERDKINRGWREPQTELALAEYGLQLLALPYAGHPDYRAEWTP